MTLSRGPRRLPAAVVLEGTWGLALLLAGRRLVALGSSGNPPPVAVAAARALGARHLVQVLVTSVSGRPQAADAGLFVQSLHVASMVALGVARRPARRLALADAAVESILGVVSAAQRRDVGPAR